MYTKSNFLVWGNADGYRRNSLSPIGKIVQTEWIKTFEMRPDMNLQMDDYVIMPNHFHAIIIIGENEYNVKRGGEKRLDDLGRLDLAQRRDAMHCVCTTMHCDSIPGGTSQNQFGPQSKNLASVIRGFKIGVTKNARVINPDFAWQSRYHDRIIRSNAEYQRISKYIRNNPANWRDDKFFDNS